MDAINDLGITQARQNRLDDAVATYRQAIAIKPNFAEAYNNMGNALRNASRFDESIECYLKALEYKPDYADAHNNLGIAYAELGRFDEAVASYTRCLKVRPEHVDAHMNRALTWLRKGDYAQGWAEYEWRWKKRNLTTRPPIMPQWNGFPLAGRRILLITEQGFGDTLQFVRFAPLLKRQGAGDVILECPEKLIKLLSRSPGIDHLVPQGKPLPDYDVYCALMNVPGLTATSVEAIPAEVPYIIPDPDLVAHWKRELAGIPGLKVGINWQGNPKYAGDRHRSIPLEFFEPLSRVPGVRLFSLQKNAGLEQLDALGGQVPGHRPGAQAGRDDRPVHGHGGGAEEPRPVHHLGHGGGPPGRCAGGAGLDAAVDDARLAMDDPSRGQPVVPDDADLPPARAHGLGPGLRADGGRAAGAGARARPHAVGDGGDRAGRADRQDHDPGDQGRADHGPGKARTCQGGAGGFVSRPATGRSSMARDWRHWSRS